MTRFVISFLLLLGALGFMASVQLYPDVDWIQSSFWKYAWPALVAVPGILLLIFSGYARRDPVLCSMAALGYGGTLLLLPMILARDAQYATDSAADEAVRSSRIALRQDILRRDQLLRAQEADRLERSKTDRFALYEGRIPDQKLDALRELDARMRAEVETQSAAYSAALDNNPTLGPSAWPRFRTLDQLMEELSAHRALYAQTRTFTQFIESFENRYEQAIQELDPPPPVDRVAIAELQRIVQTWEAEKVFALRRLDVEALASAISALEILREAWGEWSYNPRDNALSFENPDSEFAFAEAMQRFQAVLRDLASIIEKQPHSEPGLPENSAP